MSWFCLIPSLIVSGCGGKKRKFVSPRKAAICWLMLLKIGFGEGWVLIPAPKVDISHGAVKRRPSVYEDKRLINETTFKRLLILPIRSFIVNIIPDTFTVGQRTGTSPPCLRALCCKSDLLLLVAVFFYLTITLVSLIWLQPLFLPIDFLDAFLRLCCTNKQTNTNRQIWFDVFCKTYLHTIVMMSDTLLDVMNSDVK